MGHFGRRTINQGHSMELEVKDHVNAIMRPCTYHDETVPEEPVFGRRLLFLRQPANRAATSTVLYTVYVMKAWMMEARVVAAVVAA